MTKRLLIAVCAMVGLGCFGLLFYRGSVALENSADSHWLFYLYDNYFPGPSEILYLPGHIFAVKLPFLLPVFKVFGYNHFTYSLTNVVSDAIWLVACVGIIAYFHRRDTSLSARVAVFAALATSSWQLLYFTGVSTMRGGEFGLAYVLLLLCARYLTAKDDSRQTGALGLLGVCGFALILSDEFFLVAYALPVVCLAALICAAYVRHEIEPAVVKRAIILALIVTLSGIAGSGLLKMAGGQSNLPVVIATNADFTFNTFEGLGKSAALAAWGIIDLLGGDVWGKTPSAAVGLQILVMLAGLAGFAMATRHLLRRLTLADAWTFGDATRLRNEYFLFLLCGGFGFTLLAYVGTSLSTDYWSLRYLAAAPLTVGLFCALSLEWPSRGRLATPVIVACALVVLANTHRLSTELLARAPDMTYYNALSRIIEDNRVKVGYAGYWNSFSTASLTPADDLIIPVSGCAPMRYIGTQSMFSRPPEFLLVDRSGDNARFWKDCADEQLVQLYGPPKKTYLLNNGTDAVEVRILK